MKQVIVKRFYLDHVLSENKILFNTNNHYNDNGLDQPFDYYEIINQGNTKNWIDLFHKEAYHKITLDEHDLRWMYRAFQIGMVTGMFPHIYDDELEAMCKKYQNYVPYGKWFIRTDYVSLKEGMHGIGPYDSLEKIVQSMCTCAHGHECFKENDTSCNIYFMKWIDINPNKEFRVFVYQNKITAISSQHIYTVNKWLNTLTDEQISEKVNNILDYFEKNIRDKMIYMTNYVMDLALITNDNGIEIPYFIEPNSFGKNYAAGSALYHWVYDHDTLHEDDIIEFRYTNEY